MFTLPWKPFVAGLLLLANAPAHRGTVALTFDDLPVFGAFATAADGELVTDRLLDGLARHRWKATGFVNEVQLEAPDKPARIALLERWLAAGMDLGNHTYSHLSLNATQVDAYTADIARDEVETGRLLAAQGRRDRWFRYPYLETGPTRASRDAVAGWLTAHGYRIAPVTMENSDWQFSAPYDDAVARGDLLEADRIRGQYLTFTREIVAWYVKAGRALFGRQPPFVFLLHASRLNAASIDALALILRDARLRVVPLDVAMRDPAYRTTDGYVGPDGNEWLERWALTLHRDLPFESIPKVPNAIVARDARLEAVADPHFGGLHTRRDAIDDPMQIQLLVLGMAAMAAAVSPWPKGVGLPPGQVVDEGYRGEFADCDQHDEFSGHSVHGCRDDPNAVTALRRLPGGAIAYTSKLAVDLDGSPFACGADHGRMDQCPTSLMLPDGRGGEVPVDADVIPYVVIPFAGPADVRGRFTRLTGVDVGDFGYVIYRGITVPVIVADTGPFAKLGEGSVALHRALGRELCAARNLAKACTRVIDEVESIGGDVVTVLYPGSARHDLTPANLAPTIRREVERLRLVEKRRSS